MELRSYKEKGWWQYPGVFLHNLWERYKYDPYFEEKVDLIISRVLIVLSAAVFVATTGGVGAIAIGAVTLIFAAVSLAYRYNKINQLQTLERKASLARNIAEAVKCRNKLIDLLPKGKSRSSLKSSKVNERTVGGRAPRENKLNNTEGLSVIRDHALDKASTVAMIANNGLLIAEVASALSFLASGLKEVQLRARNTKKKKINKDFLEEFGKKFDVLANFSLEDLEKFYKEVNCEICAIKSLYKKRVKDFHQMDDGEISRAFKAAVVDAKMDDEMSIEGGNIPSNRTYDAIISFAEACLVTATRGAHREKGSQERRQEKEDMISWRQKFESKQTSNLSHATKLSEKRHVSKERSLEGPK
ncbi:MAG: hypothetical protein RLN62_02195 [Rickettsiales bacterium]